MAAQSAIRQTLSALLRESKRTDGYTDEVELQHNYLESNIENFISSQHFQNDSETLIVAAIILIVSF